MGVVSVTNCPKCGNRGKLIKKQSSGLDRFHCTYCKHKWNALDVKRAAAKQKQTNTPCQVCGKPSGYSGGGLCIKYYKAGKRNVESVVS